MGLVAKLRGPKSKYDAELPYTYEARVRILDGEDDYAAYVADTICGLVEFLDRHGIRPGAARVFEIYRDREVEVDLTLYSTGSEWLFRPEICRSFEKHYPGHIQAHDCSFSDRDKCGRG